MTKRTKRKPRPVAQTPHAELGQKGREQSSGTSASSHESNKIEWISAQRLQPNDYNPNRMTEGEFEELLAEVRHLGRLPKPIVVRPGGNDDFVIVDGEHNWRAACEIGLDEVPCEVLRVDDFEAMRQTYKRNQHGTHNKVLLGKMFKKMGQERGLSLRKLAKEIDVSEGTIRNTIEYLRAVKVRNSYAPGKDSEAEIAGLSMRQVRLFNRLPETLGNMWLDGGADVKALLGGYEKMKVHGEERAYVCDSEEEYLKDMGEYYEKSGLLPYVKAVRTPEQFTKALERVKQWNRWEQKYFWHNLKVKWYSRQEFRKYARYYYEGIWPFDNDRWMWMDYALKMVIKHDDEQACFRITPEEFDAVVKQAMDYCTGESKGLSREMFQDYFKLAVYEKTGERVEPNSVDVRERCMQVEIEREAPDYIRESKLEVLASKYALWKVMGDLEDRGEQEKVQIEQIARELAKERFIPRDKDCLIDKAMRKQKLAWGYDVKLEEETAVVWSAIRKRLAIQEREEHRNTASNVELAMEVTDFVYDRATSPDAHKEMSLILSRLQPAELRRLHEEISYCQWIRTLRAISMMDSGTNSQKRENLGLGTNPSKGLS